jgi:hypothetical protein
MHGIRSPTGSLCSGRVPPPLSPMVEKKMKEVMLMNRIRDRD